ncbi:MAG: hypothetical protein F2694_08235 [Actinobacteria bacterium]|nr:hypothetical protein [Actinomycetota bacterium]MSY79621.1 hypothetical protein [Actinomycetota bacterium]
MIPAASQLGERCLDLFRQPRSSASERATGILGTTIGVAAMIAMLGFASNVSLGLWTRSTVDSVAFDAARRVATAPLEQSQSAASLSQLEVQAVDSARQALGSYGQRVTMEFEHPNSSVVVLHVRSPAQGLLPRLISAGPILGAVDRRIIMRKEGK